MVTRSVSEAHCYYSLTLGTKGDQVKLVDQFERLLLHLKPGSLKLLIDGRVDHIAKGIALIAARHFFTFPRDVVRTGF